MDNVGNVVICYRGPECLFNLFAFVVSSEIITQREKLLNADWSMKRATLLAQDWSSGCLATAYAM